MKKYIIVFLVGWVLFDVFHPCSAQVKKDTLTVYIQPNFNTHGMLEAYGLFNPGDSTKPIAFLNGKKMPIPETWKINEWVPRGWIRKNN